MIRATAATWLNYATTLVFQILFAARFGSSGEAGAFVIAFAVAVSLGGVFVTTTLTNVLPRLLDKQGAILIPALRVLATLCGLIVVTALGLAILSPLLGGLIAPLLDVDASQMGTLFAYAAAFLATLAVSGLLGSVALVRGHRFLPALAPAIPSTVGVLYLISQTSPTTEATLGAMVAGGIAQLLLVALVAVLPRPRLAHGPPLHLQRLATATVLILLLMAVIPSLQRLLSAALDPSGAAHFDYASRGIQAALQLLLGGLVISLLPDWTVRHNQAQDLRPEVSRAMLLATLLLFTAGSVALVAATPILAIVYERGAFASTDTESVATLVRLMIPGFIAEGAWLVLSQAMLASGRIDVVLRVWTVRFATLMVSSLLLGLAWGANGVATAYSLSMLAMTGAALFAATRLELFNKGRSTLLRALAVGLLTIAAATTVTLAGAVLSPWLAAALVLVLAAGASVALGLREPVAAAMGGAGARPEGPAG